MNRYSEIKEKNPREIVLLKSFPCVWGKCSFCDYISDNSNSELEINELNLGVLKNITGKYNVLEVINSGSCFELPQDTLEEIKRIVIEKKIEHLFLESHWCYRYKINEMRDFFGIPITFKIGIETFDNDFRNKVLNKNARFDNYIDVKKYFDSPCIMVGIQGQSREMIDNDMNIIQEHFKHATINVFINNSSPIKRDDELVEWFVEKYRYLNDNNNIEILYNNTDFGVGE